MKDHDDERAIQDHYSTWAAQCYGCGRLNEDGLQLKTHWDGDETVTHYRPRSHHTAVPGFVYGGLVASIIDCHSTGTAAAAAYRAVGRAPGTEPELRFVTASLHVDFRRPTPIDGVLEVRGRVVELKGRKVVVESTLSAGGEVCAVGLVVAVQAPDHLFRPPAT